MCGSFWVGCCYPVAAFLVPVLLSPLYDLLSPLYDLRADIRLPFQVGYGAGHAVVCNHGETGRAVEEHGHVG